MFLLSTGSNERFCTLPGGSVLPKAWKVKSVEVVDIFKAALNENTLNS